MTLKKILVLILGLMTSRALSAREIDNNTPQQQPPTQSQLAARQFRAFLETLPTPIREVLGELDRLGDINSEPMRISGEIVAIMLALEDNQTEEERTRLIAEQQRLQTLMAPHHAQRKALEKQRDILYALYGVNLQTHTIGNPTGELTRETQQRIFFAQLPDEVKQAIYTVQRLVIANNAALEEYNNSNRIIVEMAQPIPAAVVAQANAIEENLINIQTEYRTANARLTLLYTRYGINLETLTMTNPSGN